MGKIVLIDTEPGGVLREHCIEATEANGQIFIDRESVAQVLNWRLEDEGLCRGDVCIPVRQRDALVRNGQIGLLPLAETLGRPLAVDTDGGVAVMGAAAEDRAATLRSGIAPDFTLPDITGQLHSLSDHRGKKVLLIAYASW